MIHKYRHTVLFYTLSTLIPWILWFGAAYMSNVLDQSKGIVLIESILGIAGLLSPMVIAGFFIVTNEELRKDALNKLFNFKRVKVEYIVLSFFLMLGSILLAQAISLLFGHSANQFMFSSTFSFTAGIFPAWFLLFAAPVMEELAWHSYGTDSLRTKFNLFNTCLFFGIFWGLWHLPLSFIQGNYQSNLVETGWIYSLNFPISLIPYALLMNWLYYKTGRNIWLTIVFHITAGFFNEIFKTHPDSKIIQTVLLLILSIFIITKEKDFFFKKEYIE